MSNFYIISLLGLNTNVLLIPYSIAIWFRALGLHFIACEVHTVDPAVTKPMEACATRDGVLTLGSGGRDSVVMSRVILVRDYMLGFRVQPVGSA